MASAEKNALVAYAMEWEQSDLGVGSDTIARMPITAKFLVDLRCCLESDELDDQSWGLFFAESLACAARLPADLNELVHAQIDHWLRSPSAEVRLNAARLLLRDRVLLRRTRSFGRELLADRSNDVRHLVLKNASLFLSKRDLAALFPFESNGVSVEVTPHGERNYYLRDAALSAIEQIVGRSFAQQIRTNTEDDGAVVRWRSWAPFWGWWSSPAGLWFRTVLMLSCAGFS